MKYQKINDEDRKSVINSYTDGTNATNIAKQTGLKRTTVQAIINKYLNSEDCPEKLKLKVQEKKAVPQDKTISESQREIMHSWIDENCNTPIKAIKEKMKDEMGLNVSESLINEHLKAFHFSFKRINLAPQNNDSSTLENRAIYANNFVDNIEKLDDSKVIFINEATFSVSMRRNRKAIIKKPKSNKFIPALRTKNISMCCAMSKCGIVQFEARLKLFDIESFDQFIKSIIKELKKKGISEATIIMDSAHIDKDPAMKKFIESKGYNLVSLPSYSEFLNPVEAMYTKWKQLVRGKDPQSEEELFEVLEQVLLEISEVDCKGYFEHMLSLLPKCIRKEEILNE